MAKLAPRAAEYLQLWSTCMRREEQKSPVLIYIAFRRFQSAAGRRSASAGSKRGPLFFWRRVSAPCKLETRFRLLIDVLGAHIVILPFYHWL